MEDFRLEIKKSALKNLEKYGVYREKLIELFKTLKKNPIPYRHYDVVMLKGYRHVYRVRIGKLRVIYKVNWPDKIVTILVVETRARANKEREK